MIFSKPALQICSICKKDSKIPMLDNVKLETDGTVIASARNILVAVSPVPSAVSEKIPLDKSGEVNCCVSAESIKHIVTSIKDIAFGGLLEFANIKIDDKKVSFTFKDGKRTSSVEVNKLSGSWIKWKDILKNALKRKRETKVILNRSRLKMLLEVMDKTSPDKGGESPLYLEFTDDNNVVLRSFNALTGQWTYAVMTSYKMGMDVWPEETEFEKKLLKSGKRLRT